MKRINACAVLGLCLIVSLGEGGCIRDFGSLVRAGCFRTRLVGNVVIRRKTGEGAVLWELQRGKSQVTLSVTMSPFPMYSYRAGIHRTIRIGRVEWQEWADVAKEHSECRAREAKIEDVYWYLYGCADDPDGSRWIEDGMDAFEEERSPRCE